MNSQSWPEKIIEYTFYILIFLVPLIWLPVTSELFEFNKMILVYFGAAVILTAWVFKSISEKSFTVKKTPLDIPLLLFFTANIASTVFSIDRQTSIFGYYSRFNGGLLSTISYLILYWALVTFFDKEKLFRLLKFLLLSSAIVAVYAILQHPTPLFHNADGSFRGIDADYWQQDAESRAFSTLGHPNWLAAFTIMVMPIAFFFLTAVRAVWEKLILSLLLTAHFLAFTFTYSRGGTVGFVAMLAIFSVGSIFAFRKELFSPPPHIIRFFKPFKTGFFILLVVISCAAIVYFFSNAFLSRGVNLASIKAASDTQLASAGTETGQIRLIVWKGGAEIFKNYPVFGSGLETFAYSYYQYKPTSHNLTVEWDYLYNKAHNEFVNYLATTGFFGTFSYLLVMFSFGALIFTFLRRTKEIWKKVFAIALLAGYAGYHAQNIFGFSVVAIALLFFLFPAFFFLINGSLRQVQLNLSFLEKKFARMVFYIGGLIFGIVLLGSISAMWLADYFYNQGLSAADTRAGYKNLKIATTLHPDEPLYKAELGLTTISLARETKEGKVNKKIEEGFSLLNQATSSSPQNIVIWSIRLEAVYDLATWQEQYKPQTVNTAEIVGELAPNDAKSQFQLGSMYIFTNQHQKAQKQLEKVVGMKFNYLEAWQSLFEVDAQLKDKEAQKRHLKSFSSYFPKESKDENFLKTYNLI